MESPSKVIVSHVGHRNNMMKLPNGFGSVYKLSGKRRKPWVARKTTGWMFDQEKQRAYPIYEFIGYYATRQQALTALADYNKDPYDLHHDSITFQEVYERWSEEHYPTISYSNKKGYVTAYKTSAELYDMRIRDIKLDHLQRVVDTSGKNTPALQRLKGLYGQMWDYCVRHEILPPDKRTMVTYVDVKKAGNPNKTERIPFSTTEIDYLWSVVSTNIYMEIVLMLIYTGVRVSELLDLKQEDVFLEERYFCVKASKTEAGIREVPIAKKVLPFFQHWMSKNNDYLLSRPDGGHFEYRNYYKYYWLPIMDKLSMNHTPHDTRHTCVSLLTSAGVDDRIIKKIVGHKGHDVTQAVYTHLDLQTKLDAIDKI